MDKQSKNARTLDIYARLCEGKVINKAAEAERFEVDERTIQRDINDIRAFLGNRCASEGSDVRTIVYNRILKGFMLNGAEASMMTNSEILAVAKILLESRAFTRKELKVILDKLVDGCVPLKNMKLVRDLISNERFHYVELNHKEYIQDRLWNIGSDIQEHNLVSIQYARANEPEESVRRVVEPVSILFSEYYFYLNAFIVEKDEHGKYEHKYNYPAIFRIDRIRKYKHLKEKFKIAYVNRFEEGEFRKRIQFMYAGRLMNIRLKYYGDNPEPILDRLPTARVVSEEEQAYTEVEHVQTEKEDVHTEEHAYEIKEHAYTIEAEVYGKGCIMWLLSQGKRVEVIKPESLRNEMKNILTEMLGRYQ